MHRDSDGYAAAFVGRVAAGCVVGMDAEFQRGVEPPSVSVITPSGCGAVVGVVQVLHLPNAGARFKEALLAVLCYEAVVKVLHARRNDLQQMYQLCGGVLRQHVSASVFDTQDAFEAVQGGYQRPLKEVILHVLYREAVKSHALRVETEWQKKELLTYCAKETRAADTACGIRLALADRTLTIIGK